TMKGIPENIRSFYSHPGEAIHLKPAGFDVAVKRAPIVALDGDINADLVEVILDNGGQPQPERVGRGFIGDERAMAVIKSRSDRQLFRQVGSVLVARQG